SYSRDHTRVFAFSSSIPCANDNANEKRVIEFCFLLARPPRQNFEERSEGYCLKVLVVYNVVDLLDKGQSDDMLAEQETKIVEEAVARSLRSFGHQVTSVPIRHEL